MYTIFEIARSIGRFMTTPNSMCHEACRVAAMHDERAITPPPSLAPCRVKTADLYRSSYNSSGCSVLHDTLKFSRLVSPFSVAIKTLTSRCCNRRCLTPVNLTLAFSVLATMPPLHDTFDST
eukprot:COSAG05_NODE_1860_length_3945_cov_16.773011_2_plen_122_part_00